MHLPKFKRIKVAKKKAHKKEYVNRQVSEKDFAHLITENCIINDGKENIILYAKLEKKDMEMVKALRAIKYGQSKRVGGLKGITKIFGYRIRKKRNSKDYCSSAALAVDNKKSHEKVCSFAKEMTPFYEHFFSAKYLKHKETLEEKILPEYVIKGTVFTSGIINLNSALNYHYDTGNFNDVCSCMIVYKEDVEGGYLSCPELNIGFELADNTIIIFDGQSILHGVTPIKYCKPSGYRLSVVYYSLKNMWQCLEFGQELERAKKVKSERELSRAYRSLNVKAEIVEKRDKSLKERNK